MAKPRALHIQNEVTDPCVPFIEALEAHGFDVETVHSYAGEGLPGSLRGISAVVAGGGLVDTHQAEEYPWLAHEISLVAEAIETRAPSNNMTTSSCGDAVSVFVSTPAWR